MTTPVWQSGTLYNPGALVIPQSAPPVVQSAPDNPDFESGATGWTYLESDFTIGQFGVAYVGTWSLRWTAQTYGVAINDNYVPVTPGQSITAGCNIQQRGHQTNSCQGRVQIRWYTASFGYISTDEGNGIGGNGFNAFNYSQVTATAPAGAAYAVIGASAYRTLANATQLYFDNFQWNYTYSNAPEGMVYKAVQADAGFSGSAEPTWPTVQGNTVVDNEVTWEAVVTTRVTWEATPILVSGSTEPTWPTSVGGNVLDNTINWRATSRRITDAKCPQSPYVVIAASKIFAADEDIIRYSATVNCLDWSTADDAGYLPFGLQTYGASPVKAMGLYRSNLVAFNAEGFQMWQVDQDPASMALLDAVPVGSQYHEALQPLANDLIFTSDIGARNVGIAGASTNLQAEGIGEPIDPLVQAALDEGVYSPLGALWPAAGQYWLIFGDEAFILTVNGTKKKSWSRYTFPEAITDWALHAGALHLRTAENHVWKVMVEAVVDDAYAVPGLDGSTTNSTTVLVWDAMPTTSETVGYRVYDGDTDTLIAALGDVLTYPVTDQENGVHSFYVTAVNAEGTESDPSPTLTQTVSATNGWVGKNATSTNDWRAVAWSPSLGIFVAMTNSSFGGAGRTMTSPDGSTWTASTTLSHDGWTAVCWAPELNLFVSVSNFDIGRAATSPDGVNWTVQTTPNTNAFWGVCWAPELSLFVAVSNSGTGNRVMTSPDGVTWTARTSAADNSWLSVCWAPELSLFVAVSNSGTGNRVMTSPDGVTWTARTSAADLDWRHVCWSPELAIFVAVASSGTGNRVMTSSDGINWVSRVSAADSGWDCVVWSLEYGIFVAVGTSSGAGSAMISSDGVNWSVSTSGAPNRTWDSICWAPEIETFCAVASGSGSATDKVMINQALSTPQEGGGAAAPTITSEPVTGVVHWPFLDLDNPGANKQLVGFDVTTDAPEGVSVSIGYNQRDISQRTADYEVPADTLDGSMIAMPLNAPSFDLKLTFEPDQEWEFFAANLYINDGRRG